MKLKSNEKEILKLAFSDQELNIIRNSIMETMKYIEHWEFPIRMGVTLEEAQAFLAKIEEVINHAGGKANIEMQMSKDEGLIVNNALNEICNGIKILEFETHIGASMADSKKLLDEVHKIL